MNKPCAHNVYSIVLPLLLSMVVSGCATQGYSIIAATATTIGVNVSQDPTNGSPVATLGYKRAEFAFVPSNRNSNKSSAGSLGEGAKDTGNVIMELRYSGMSESGIYQRLAVGDIAVRENGTALLFAKGPDGKIDADAARALEAVRKVPASDPEADAAKVPLVKKYKSYDPKKEEDKVNIKKFDDAAILAGFKDFKGFILDQDTTPQKVKAMRKILEDTGIQFN